MANGAIALQAKYETSQACSAAIEFNKIFYECLDKNRTRLRKLYSPDASLTWNGNFHDKADTLINFILSLPTSTTIVDSLDCQPYIKEMTGGETLISVSVMGSIEFEGNPIKGFSETFLLKAETSSDSKSWKIIADSFRFFE